jgi:hypothetical protein
MMEIINKGAVDRREYWIDEIVQISGHFGDDSSRIEVELEGEVGRDGVTALLDHLRLCSSIPESYGHDSSEEKLYSKYTDALISACFSFIGLKSVVLAERADAADVEAVSNDYSFIADAKVFRLSRTAKNQKDFKVQAMDNWKRGKPYAMVVCPLYQLPSKNSQIYQQAISRNVCIFSYSHLAVIVQICGKIGKKNTMDLLLKIFRSTESMNPTKEASPYWKSINTTMLNFHHSVSDFWKIEKIASAESLKIAKEIALSFYSSQREKIMRMSHDEAIKELLDVYKIDSKMATVRSVSDSLLMGVK